MTLKEFWEKTDWMSPETEIIVNCELTENLETCGVLADQEADTVVLMVKRLNSHFVNRDSSLKKEKK